MILLSQSAGGNPYSTSGGVVGGSYPGNTTNPSSALSRYPKNIPNGHGSGTKLRGGRLPTSSQGAQVRVRLESIAKMESWADVCLEEENKTSMDNGTL